jgi:hypothetical protein
MVASDFPEVHLICNEKNLLFTRAHNQALKIALGDYFLVLNPDTEIPPQTLKSMVGFLERNPEIGAVGCQERRPDNSVEYTGSKLSTPWIELIERSSLRQLYHFRQKLYDYRMKDWNRKSSRDVDVLTNCFFMLPTNVLKEMNGHEERLLLYFSENDLCLRLKQSRRRVHFLADYYYIHHGQKSSIQLVEANTIFRRDMFTYYLLHFGLFFVVVMKIAFWLIDPLVKFYEHVRIISEKAISKSH